MVTCRYASEDAFDHLKIQASIMQLAKFLKEFFFESISLLTHVFSMKSLFNFDELLENRYQKNRYKQN